MQTVSTTIEFAPEAMTWGDLQRIAREHDGIDPSALVTVRTTFASRVKRMTIVEAVGER